jgi:CDP-Glycerol:Poly(glycerophosphate) glycerophosphotransferase
MAGAARSRAKNYAAAPRFAARVMRRGTIPAEAVALYFATAPENFYQFELWRRPLERLAESRPVFVIVDRPDTGQRVLATTSLPIAFARSSAALERLVGAHRIRVVLYVNQVEANFRMLRFPGPVHIQLGHGESDKVFSVSNQHKAYDLTFVGGPAGRDRLAHALRGFDAEARTVQVGRPQLDHEYPGAPDWPRDSGLRVMYAPTWEGDRPSTAYGSVASHGVAIVKALLADPSIRVIYRPHPRTGQVSPSFAAADRRIRGMLAGGGDRHLVDHGDYGWQWAFADACITDISSVAYDWLATGKPLVITEPVAESAYRPPSALLDALPLLPAAEAREVRVVLQRMGVDGGRAPRDPRLIELAGYYFGETAGRASSRRFAAAIEQAYALSAPGGVTHPA